MPTQRFLTTAELAQATAGGDNYIRTKDKVVRALAYDPKKNLFAPNRPGEQGVIVFGTGRRRKWSAELFLSTKAVVPAFVKRDVNAWEYIGEYRAMEIRSDAGTIEWYRGDRPANKQAGVLFIEPAFALEVDVSGGGFPNPETRKRIELAAVKVVTATLEQRGYAVKDRSAEKLGYDLEATSRSGKLFVEVKGTDWPDPHFFLTRKESTFSTDNAEWRLFVVCNARSAPNMKEYTSEEMRTAFHFDPLAYECTSRSSIAGNGNSDTP